jgi:type II secretory pathway pseudopilin PulG
MDRIRFFLKFIGTAFRPWRATQPGFTQVEFLISAGIMLILSASLFGLLSDTQHAAVYQNEIQSVIENTTTALDTIERYIQEAGNDPLNIGLSKITVLSSTAVRIQSDLTGSAGPGDPDKGDPDGDVNDSGEDVTIRYNDATRSLEVVSGGGGTQILAGSISGFNLQYFDSNGNATIAGNEVRKISISVSGTSLMPNPQTRQVFGIRISSEVQVPTGL